MSETDTDAVSRLFDDALPQVYGYLRRRCGSTDLAEELTATAFVRATNAACNGTVESVTVGWLITIARNLLVDHWRHQALVERSMVLLEERTLVEDPWSEVLDATVAEAMLATLKPLHRTALVLRYLDDLPVAEVATALNRSVRATESLLVRARTALRTAYETTQDPNGGAHA